MPKTALTETEFKKEVAALAHLQQEVATLLRPAVQALLRFAKEYSTLYEKVHGAPVQVRSLRERLGVNDYQHQRLMGIARQSKTLGTVKRALPPAVEPLYEAALLVQHMGGDKLLRDAVKDGEVTPTSGMRVFREMRQELTAPSGAQHVGSVTPKQKRIRPYALKRFEFVFVADKIPRWNEVEAFKNSLTELLGKHEFRLLTNGNRVAGFRNAESLEKYLKKFWTLKDQETEMKRERDEQAEAQLRGSHFDSDDERNEALREARLKIEAEPEYAERWKRLRKQGDEWFGR